MISKDKQYRTRDGREVRIAYKMIYRCDPNGILDHIDGNMTNNKIANCGYGMRV